MASETNSIPNNTIIDSNAQTSSVSAPIDPNDPQNLSMDALFRLIMFESTEQLRLQKINELKKLSSSQNEIGFLNNLRRVFMLGTNEDGTFTVNDELKKLLDKVSNPGSESLMQLLDELGLNFSAIYSKESFQALFSGISALEDSELRQTLSDQLESLGIKNNQEPTKEQLEQLVQFVSQPENLALRKHLTDNGILTTKTQFSKPERENFIESIRLFVDQKSTINEMSSQTVIRLQSEIDKMQMYVIELVKSDRDLKRKFLNHVGRHA